MMFAETADGKRIEATKGAVGRCPFCNELLIAKCGNININHWAHQRSSGCDAWSEKERPWHLKWKSQFRKEWQEKIFIDETSNEKHIADVCTNHNYVIEFQHSSISEEEKLSREIFFKNMCWVADVSGLRNRQRLSRALTTQYNLGVFSVFVIHNPQQSLPLNWIKRRVFVFLDYKGEIDTPEYNYLLGIVPIRFDVSDMVVFKIMRHDFVELINNKLPETMKSLRESLEGALQKRFDREHLSVKRIY